MKKTFLLFVLFLAACSSNVYEDQVVTKEDGKAYLISNDKLYSGPIVDENGTVVGEYKAGIKNGPWDEKNYNNGTRKIANYVNGVPEGEQITYIFPGATDNNKRLEYIRYENGKPVGTWTKWGKDKQNKLIKTGEIVFEEGSGRWREWDPNTLVITRAGDYENWERTGTWKSWDPNEVIVSEGEYVDGKKTGKWVWFENGEPKGWEENYESGTLNGNFFNLSPFSEMRGKGEFNSGIKNGEWEEYYTQKDRSLELKQKGTYVEGVKQGIWSLYAKNGRRIAEGTYENNQKNGTWTEGQDIDFGSRFYGKGTYSSDKKNGSWKYVAPRQNPIIDGSFTDGEPSGEWKVVYNGQEHVGTLEDLLNKIPKLKEYKF